MVLSVLLTKYTSCIAAIVASMHIAVTLYDGSIKVSDNGKMNKANPVTLFNVLCMDNSSFLRTKTNAKLNILINAIILIHTHNHTGMNRRGILNTALLAVIMFARCFFINLNNVRKDMAF